MELAELGDRICIIGQSGGGKSTLAAAIGSRLRMPVVHLDQFRHLPGTQWMLRGDDEFVALHDAAIAGDRWVVEGNYSALLPRRLERATGLIVVDMSTGASLIRYVRRTVGRSTRVGGLPGTEERISWAMIAYTLRHTRANRRRRRRSYDEATVPKVFLSGAAGVRGFYGSHGLERP